MQGTTTMIKRGGGQKIVSRLLQSRPRHFSSLRATVAEQHKIGVEPSQRDALWQKFVANPALWWDTRSNKSSRSYPDFVHSATREALWIDSQPAWVEEVRSAKRLSDQAGFVGSQDSERVAWCEAPLELGSWTQLCEQGDLREAVDSLDLLVQRVSFVPASLFYNVLKGCVARKDLVSGRHVHALSLKCGHESNTFLANHFIRMYSSHGRLQEAMQVFHKLASPNTFTWSFVILAHAEHGQPGRAIELYHQMMQTSSLKPDNHVFSAVLKACVGAADLAAGKLVHADVLGNGTEPNVFVSNCLVDMYAKCGSLADARRVFDSLGTRDVVTWNAMISGYTQHGLGQEALALYASMQEEGVTAATNFTYSCLLKACASVGALQQGKQLHFQIQERGLEGDVVVGNSLVDMYSKCGSLDDARKVFDRLPRKDVVTWNALLNGYGQHNAGQRAVKCFREMQQHGVGPDDATFICLLVACSHQGLVTQGQQYFRMMVEDHGITPAACHYNCMVDVLARAGHLDEAEKLLLAVPFDTSVAGWTSLLTACRSHGDVDRGRRCFDRLILLEPQYAGAYVLMSNIYANAGRWQDVDSIESLRKLTGACKKPARAWIEVGSKVHAFVVGEEREDLSSRLKSANLQLKEEGGHVPHTDIVLRPVPEQEKEDALCGHAEKLALAFGLLNTADGTPLLVTKNLRMCDDCHSGTKIMSRVEKREIIVRDGHRVHRFVEGCCSCGDGH